MIKHIITPKLKLSSDRAWASRHSVRQYLGAICFAVSSTGLRVVGEDCDGVSFFCVRRESAFCASATSPQSQLTALWAGGRFLPWWAFSPAWRRRLDVIKVYTLSPVSVCVCLCEMGTATAKGADCCSASPLCVCEKIKGGLGTRTTGPAYASAEVRKSHL